MNCDHKTHYHYPGGGLNAGATSSSEMYGDAGIYCYDCGKFLGKDPEDVEYPKQETWHDRPSML